MLIAIPALGSNRTPFFPYLIVLTTYPIYQNPFPGSRVMCSHRHSKIRARDSGLTDHNVIISLITEIELLQRVKNSRLWNSMSLFYNFSDKKMYSMAKNIFIKQYNEAECALLP